MTTPCPHCNDTRTITLLYSQVPCECAAPWWSLQDGSDMVPSTPTPHTRPPSVHSAEWYRALNRACPAGYGPDTLDDHRAEWHSMSPEGTAWLCACLCGSSGLLLFDQYHNGTPLPPLDPAALASRGIVRDPDGGLHDVTDPPGLPFAVRLRVLPELAAPRYRIIATLLPGPIKELT